MQIIIYLKYDDQEKMCITRRLQRSYARFFDGQQMKTLPSGSVFTVRSVTFNKLLIFALLVSNATRCLASRLAGCLALAATAVVNCLYDILCFDSLNSVHDVFLRK